MAIFKCKMCGGTLEINNNETVVVCEYCGTKQTLPKLDDERKASLYDRANYFRRENEFDKAMGIYEMILNEDYEDSESYWGIVLCRYGIEYVEDPVTHKRVPTVNRAQFTSIYDDEHYKKAYQYADGYQRDVYAAEAKAIDDIQKGILEISRKEEPFDVFICYKETDRVGNRTQDSVYAQDIYKALTKEGYKVFFSRITLEDKLGTAYEPYIFAALNSAKVMLVVGTEKDNFNAVWVKNEWSRFLSLIKAGKGKALIPVYKDISPYEMPEEFQYLQSQDMAKIGFMQDLLHGVQKLIEADKKSGNDAINSNATQIQQLTQRAKLLLNEGDFDRADMLFEQVLSIDAFNVQAYLGKLLAETKVKTEEDLATTMNSFTYSKNYKKLLEIADDKLKDRLVKLEAQSKAFQSSQKTKKVVKILSIPASLIAVGLVAVLMFTVIIPKIKFSNIIDIAATGDATIGLKENGTVVIAHNILRNDFDVSDWDDIIQISAEGEHLVGLKSDGTVVATGDNSNGQCDVSGWTDIVAVCAGEYHTLGIKSDGTVVTTKEYEEDVVSTWTNIIAIGAGNDFSVGLKSDGTVVTTKEAIDTSYIDSNGEGDITLEWQVDKWTDIVAINAGPDNIYAIRKDGTVVTEYLYPDAEDNEWHQYYEWTDIVSVVNGAYHTVGLESDGTVVAYGNEGYGRCDVDEWTDIVKIAASANHTVGLKSDGTVVAVGHHGYGKTLVGGKK